MTQPIDEKPAAEYFFSTLDTLRWIQLGNNEDKKIFNQVHDLASSLLYLSDTCPNHSYPNNKNELEEKLDEQIEHIHANLLEIKKLVIKKKRTINLYSSFN